jgi:hypothetical protein
MERFGMISKSALMGVIGTFSLLGIYFDPDPSLGLELRPEPILGLLVFHRFSSSWLRNPDRALQLLAKRGPQHGYVGKSCRSVWDNFHCGDDFLLRALPDQHPPYSGCRGASRFSGSIPDRIIVVRIGVQFGRDYLHDNPGR